MDLTTFEDGLDRYGADLATWPQALGRAAAAFLETSQEARAACRDLVDIEGLLRSERPVMADAGGLAARAMRHRQDRIGRRVVRRTGWGLAAVVALLLGLIVGGGVGIDHGDGPDHVMATALEQTAPSDVD